ncbi:MAG: nucleotidyltransferase domain-containing protein [Candidatus Aenigmatarchaeota archaeon]
MSILNVMKKNKNIRKLFGEREIKIIEKQLSGVRLKPSEKTRLSRDIRKKFEAIKALAPFVDSFQLKHGALIKDFTKEAKEVILESKYSQKIRRIILFGSAVEHKLTIFSDIDIAVEIDHISKEETNRFRLDVMKKINEKIELHIYNNLPNKIRKEIDAKGRVIYERKNKRQA